jgi:hypothetical protein
MSRKLYINQERNASNFFGIFGIKRGSRGDDV